MYIFKISTGGLYVKARRQLGEALRSCQREPGKLRFNVDGSGATAKRLMVTFSGNPVLTALAVFMT